VDWSFLPLQAEAAEDVLGVKGGSPTYFCYCVVTAHESVAREKSGNTAHTLLTLVSDCAPDLWRDFRDKQFSLSAFFFGIPFFLP